MRKCDFCGTEFEPKREDARFCSANCRKKYSRALKVEEKPVNVLSTPLGSGGAKVIPVPGEVITQVEEQFTDKSPFYHYRKNYRTKSGYWEDEDGKPIVYSGIVKNEPVWQNVPLNAVPVLKRGMPTMPSYMNGRQYYLWQLNGFKTDDRNRAQIIDPIPSRGTPHYEMGGDGSRRWGA